MHSEPMRLLRPWVVGVALAATTMADVSAVGAQPTQGTLAGVVRDARGPLPRALVRLDTDQGNDSARVTDEAGRFRFDGVSRGPHTLSVIRLGYRPRSIAVVLGDAGLETTIELVPLPPTLDTLHVVASQASIVGTVFSAADKRPVSRARVSLQVSRVKVETDTAGRFALSRVSEGAYVLYVEAPGFLPYMLSVMAPREGAVEVAVAMRTPAMDRNKGLAGLLTEFNVRTRTASGMNSALIPRQELMANENELLSFAIQISPSFLKKGLRMSVECLFIDGEPQQASLLDDIKVSQVEAVEVYGPGADWSQSLARRWGARPSCGLRSTNGLASGVRRAPARRWCRRWSSGCGTESRGRERNSRVGTTLAHDLRNDSAARIY